MFEVAFNNPRRSCWATGLVVIRMEENKSGFRRKKCKGIIGRESLAVEKHNIKIGTLELPDLFHIIEYAENISVATGVNRAGWRWR